MNDNNTIKYVKSSGFDGLSEVLQLLKLDVDIYHNAKVCGDWRIDEHTIGATCFHIVTLGSCMMSVPGHSPTKLNVGDLVIFPRELTHHMLPSKPQQGAQQHLSFEEAKTLEGTGILCGEVRFQHTGSRFLLDALPVFFIIRHSDNNHWLNSILELIVYENNNSKPASKTIINRLSELLFSYALRQHLENNPDESGMLAVYGDHHLSNAIRCIHNAPQKNWTLASLAKEVGLSRTVFTEKFKAISGWTVGQYLIWWRMQLAWSLLSNGNSVSQVADSVGYKSESSFSRAFSKMFAISAGKVRRNLI